ncbi:hypothetical protein P9112_005631 [Eukaryota sp. TZLM1-RC]
MKRRVSSPSSHKQPKLEHFWRSPKSSAQPSPQSPPKASSPLSPKSPPKASSSISSDIVDISDGSISSDSDDHSPHVPCSPCRWFQHSPSHYFSSSLLPLPPLDPLPIGAPLSTCIIDLVRLLGLMDPFKPLADRYLSLAHLVALLYYTEKHASMGNCLVCEKVVEIISQNGVTFSEIFEFLSSIDPSTVRIVRDICSFFFQIESDLEGSGKSLESSNQKMIDKVIDEEYLPSSDDEADDEILGAPKRILLITGPSGSEKSSLISFITSLINFNCLTFGSEIVRSKEWFNSIHEGLITKSLMFLKQDSCSNFENLESRSRGLNQRGVIILDDLDSDDQIDEKVIIQLIQSSKRPLILIGRSCDSQLISKIINRFHLDYDIKFNLRPPKIVSFWVFLTCFVENFQMHDEVIRKFENLDNLMVRTERSLLNHLQIALSLAKFNKEVELNCRHFVELFKISTIEFGLLNKHLSSIINDPFVELLQYYRTFDEKFEYIDYSVPSLSTKRCTLSLKDQFALKTLSSRWELVSFARTAFANEQKQSNNQSRSRRRSRRRQHFHIDENFKNLFL